MKKTGDKVRHSEEILSYASVRFQKNERYSDIEMSDSVKTGMIRPKIRLYLLAEDKFFGPGVCELLELIHQTGSIQDACARMELSYSKGSRMIKKMEKQIGFQVVRRWAGGRGGGGAALTPEGEKLMEDYQKMVIDLQEYTEKSFHDYLGKDFNWDKTQGGQTDEIDQN